MSEERRKFIKIRGANEHNLKNISLEIPRNELVVLTGLSGSGKSSLAFDTIYAEGQRRYMESLSSYARQFLGQMEKPDVESIEGLSPAISIDQKSTNRNPRSTVGTVTEIYDYFRLLYARIGTPHGPKCGREIHKQSVDQMVDQIMALPERTKIQLLAPVVKGRKGEHVKVLEKARSGIYRHEELKNLTPQQLQRYFMRGTGPHEGLVRVRQELANYVDFAPLNLLAKQYTVPGPFDAIFCRNVMIYFDQTTQQEILRRFVPLLKPDGLLFAGHSENFSHLERRFTLRGQTVYALSKD